VLPAPKLFGLNVSSITHPQRYAIVTIVVFAVLGLAVLNLRRGRAGRRLVAIRDNERAAAALGLSVFQVKLYAFSVAAAIAAAAGGLIAWELPTVNYGQYDVMSSIQAVLYAVVGGIGSVAGAAVGGTLAPGGLGQWVVNHWFSVTTTLALITGVLTVLTVIFQPDGVALKNQEWLRPVMARLRRSRPGIVLPEAAAVRVSPHRLEVRDIAVSFGGVAALRGVSLSVQPGEVVGLIGPNGAGKTTLVDVIAGNTPAGAGRVLVDEMDASRWSVAKRARAGIGRSFQSLELFEEMTVADNLRVASDPGDAISYLRDLVRPRAVPFSPAAVAAITEFGLRDVLESPVASLPYGQRHLVALARTVARTPSVLLLDEPVAGLDARERQETGHLIGRLAREWGMAIVLIEHDVELVMSTCDRVVALDFGQVIAQGTPEEVRHDPELIAAYLGQHDAPVGQEQGAVA